MPSHSEDTVTVLRTVGKYSATKRWQWNATLHEWSKTAYEAGAKFRASTHEVADLRTLAARLENLRRDPTAFIVRGDLTPEVRASNERDPGYLIPRRKHLKKGVAPMLVEANRRWVMIDVDNYTLRDCDDLASDPDTIIDAAIHGLLPSAFHDAECWWQLSSSAGFAAEMLKAHLFFWLDASASNEHIKAVLKQHAPGVDRAPFSAAQPHYIADPIIQGGADPLPRRTGWRRGLEAAVTLPALTTPPAGSRGTTGRPTGTAGGVEALGDGPGLDGFHAPLRTATMRYAAACSRHGTRDDAAIKAQLLAAIERAPKAAGRDASEYDAAYLDRLIGGAFALIGGGDGDLQSMRPHHALPVGSVHQARDAIGDHVGGFLGRALAWHGLDEAQRIEQPPEHAGLSVVVGGGKSTATRKALPSFIPQARAAGLPHRVLWLIPHH